MGTSSIDNPYFLYQYNRGIYMYMYSIGAAKAASGVICYVFRI